MGKLRLVNEGDEAITLEPGESIDLRGESDTLRGCVVRRQKFVVDTLK